MGDYQRHTGQAVGQLFAAQRAPLLLGVIVFLACLFGIFTRFENFLAALWPANAIMVGLLLRIPACATPAGWLYACLAFVSADLLTGSPPLKALILNGANLCGIATTYVIYTRLPKDSRLLQHPMSMLHLSLACFAGGLASGVVGGLTNPLLFNGTVAEGLSFWLVTEYVYYIAILPVILSAPALHKLLRKPGQIRAVAAADLAPLLALILSCFAMVVVGGPGAIAFPVPALLWCGLTYSVFPTTLLTLLASIWTLTLVATHYAGDLPRLISFRLGVSLIALGPIMLSCVMQRHNLLLSTLKHVAAHDGLTGASTRLSFLDHAQRMLQSRPRPVGVMMIDLDHFKQINDTQGHASGDAVLVAISRRIRNCLRGDDLLGRLGGEEFAIVMAGRSVTELRLIAERIHQAVGGTEVNLPNGLSIRVTTSIGLVVADAPEPLCIDQLLLAADAALYQAKRAGRDRVLFSAFEGRATANHQA